MKTALFLLLASVTSVLAQYAPGKDWPVATDRAKLGNLHGDMAADSKGNLYVSTGRSILVFNKNGEFLRNLGVKWKGVHGMKVRKQDGEEFLFIAQNGQKTVSKIKLDGTPVWQIVGPPKKEGLYPNAGRYNPTDVDIAPDGRIYVADGYGMSLMHIYDKDRNYVKTFGGKGKEDGKFNVCHNVIVDTRGGKTELLISDRQNNRLQKYDMDGNFVASVATDLKQPCAADIHGDILAVGELGGRVSIYDKDNKLIQRLGDKAEMPRGANRVPPAKWIEGATVSIHGCTYDPDGNLYAMDWNVHGRVTKFAPAN